ncbi:hypothetical protein ACIBI0_29685 [Microbispora rosea]|uniref:hypothetical protein n=1 Tax=Microbispora rosea TaxID=58117 RepID=UPI0037B289FD
MFEVNEDERGSYKVTDPAGAERGVLQGHPAFGEEGEAAARQGCGSARCKVLRAQAKRALYALNQAAHTARENGGGVIAAEVLRFPLDVDTPDNGSRSMKGRVSGGTSVEVRR